MELTRFDSLYRCFLDALASAGVGHIAFSPSLRHLY